MGAVLRLKAKSNIVQISLVISLLATLVLLGWWITANTAMLSSIALHPQKPPAESQSPASSQQSIPIASYKPSHYLFFNGNNSYGSIPPIRVLNVNQFSVAFWVKSDGPPHQSFDRAIEMLEWKKNSIGTPIAYGWAFDAGDITKVGNNKLRFTVGNTLGNLYTTEPVSISSTSWTHIVGTFDGTSLKLYQNGVLASTSSPFNGAYGRPITPIPIRLAQGWLSQHYWTGDLSDIRIYNRSLSQPEISSIYNGHNEASGLIGYWKLNEGFGSNIHDSSGNNNNGRIHNGLWR